MDLFTLVVCCARCGICCLIAFAFGFVGCWFGLVCFVWCGAGGCDWFWFVRICGGFLWLMP